MHGKLSCAKARRLYDLVVANNRIRVKMGWNGLEVKKWWLHTTYHGSRQALGIGDTMQARQESLDHTGSTRYGHFDPGIGLIRHCLVVEMFEDSKKDSISR